MLYSEPQYFLMNITFHGAAREVTGSCHLIEANGKRLLLDCGMFQGSAYNEGKNGDVFPFDPKSIDAVFISHAHADHSGRIPKLVRDGYTGPVYATKPTIELAELIWRDSYSIMQYENKKFQAPILFTEVDIEQAAQYCHGLDYGEVVDLGDGVSVVLKDAGHIFGSAFIEVRSGGKAVAFSGDVGNANVPILRDTDRLGAVDVLLLESTYGDRIHEDERQRKDILLDIVREGCKRGGTIMMPAFSLERTQEIIYMLEELFEEDKTLPHIPIFIDSPLAIRAVATYERYPQFYDHAAAERFSKTGDGFLKFDSLTFTETIEQSKKINHVPQPKMIIAGAGMMNGGRILHHAKRYLSDPASMLVLVGYQADNTLGRRLYEGAEKVTIHNEDVEVRCKVKAIGALSAHADKEKLISWVRNAETVPERVYCVHGEAHAATELAHALRDELDIKTFVPERGERVEL